MSTCCLASLETKTPWKPCVIGQQHGIVEQMTQSLGPFMDSLLNCNGCVALVPVNCVITLKKSSSRERATSSWAGRRVKVKDKRTPLPHFDQQCVAQRHPVPGYYNNARALIIFQAVTFNISRMNKIHYLGNRFPSAWSSDEAAIINHPRWRQMTPNCITHHRHNPLGHNSASGLALVLLTQSSCLTPYGCAMNTLHFYHDILLHFNKKANPTRYGWRKRLLFASLGDEHQAQNKIWWAIATTRINWSDHQVAIRGLRMCRRNGSCLLCISGMNCWWLKKALRQVEKEASSLFKRDRRLYKNKACIACMRIKWCHMSI